jgi:hypothetical protein
MEIMEFWERKGVIWGRIGNHVVNLESSQYLLVRIFFFWINSDALLSDIIELKK